MTENRLDPVVQQVVEAINSGDAEAFYRLMADGASMSDDGSERELRPWVQGEVFEANGRMRVESVGDGGREFVAEFTNDRWGAMRTAWRFTVADGRVSRFETGQA